MGLSRWDIVSVWASAQGDFTVSWVAPGNCHISIVASGAHKGSFAGVAGSKSCVRLRLSTIDMPLGREAGGGRAHRVPQSPHVPSAEQSREPPRVPNYARMSLR